jgi:hypothetical protein
MRKATSRCWRVADVRIRRRLVEAGAALDITAKAWVLMTTANWLQFCIEYSKCIAFGMKTGSKT